jgi:UDP-N-acetylglucosamine 2-epimerase
LNEPVVFPAHPRTRKFLQETGYQPPENMKLIDPVGYFDVISLEIENIVGIVIDQNPDNIYH